MKLPESLLLAIIAKYVMKAYTQIAYKDIIKGC